MSDAISFWYADGQLDLWPYAIARGAGASAHEGVFRAHLVVDRDTGAEVRLYLPEGEVVTEAHRFDVREAVRKVEASGRWKPPPWGGRGESVTIPRDELVAVATAILNARPAGLRDEGLEAIAARVMLLAGVSAAPYR